MEYQNKTKYMRNGDFMTRICAVANDKQCVVAADTMLTNSYTKEKSYRNKIIYKNGLIISLSGTLEIFAGPVKVDFIQYFEDYINHVKNPFSLSDIEKIERELNDIFIQYPFYDGLCINYYWTDGQVFRTYCYEIVTNKNISLGSLVKYPFGKIQESNKDLFIFNNHILHCGEGVDGIYVLNSYDMQPVEASNIVQEAIANPQLSTVGGKVQSVEMNLDGSIREIFE